MGVLAEYGKQGPQWERTVAHACTLCIQNKFHYTRISEWNNETKKVIKEDRDTFHEPVTLMYGDRVPKCT